MTPADPDRIGYLVGNQPGLHVGDRRIGGVQRFTENLGVTYPAGVEPTSNYLGCVRNYRGANPFPVDIIVDRARCRPARRDMFRTINGIDGSFWPPSAGT